MPNDPKYGKGDLLGDIHCTGSWTLPKDIKPETGDFIAELVETLA